MTFYLSGAGAYCAFLLFKKFSDKECSKTDPVSWAVIAIAATFWIVVIPLSAVELRTKAKQQAQLNSVLNSNRSSLDLPKTQLEPKKFESNSIFSTES